MVDLESNGGDPTSPCTQPSANFFWYPEPTKWNAKDYGSGEDPKKIQAEVTYRQIYDAKAGGLNNLGSKLL
jgi:hypothetical protein